jgi:protein phosphatase
VQVEGKLKSGKDPLKALNSALQSAHKRIRRLVEDDPALEGMGTTVTAMLWTGEQFGLAHIGDSRGYRLRDGELEQITTDHTFVQSLVDEGRITAEQASVHPARSMILKALQGEVEPQVDLEMLDVRAGDRFLLCSDGLTDYVSAEPIGDLLRDKGDRAQAAGAIVALALKAGAPDNVTVILADVIDTDNPPGPDDTAESYLVGAASDDPPPPPPAARLRPSGGARTLVSETASSNGNHDDTAVGTIVEDVDAEAGDAELEASVEGDLEELRYAPRPPRRLRWLRWLAALVVLAGIAWAGIAIANNWIRGQYFVGEQGGEVAIYRGINQSIGSLNLFEYVGKPASLPVGALPQLYRDRVAETIPEDSRRAAEDTVEDLLAKACDVQPEPPTVLEEAGAAESGTDAEPDPGVIEPAEPGGGGEPEPGTGEEAEVEPDQGDAAAESTSTATQAPGVEPDTQVNQPEEQPQTSGYPGLVCPEDQ